MATQKPLFGEDAAQSIYPKIRRAQEERGHDPAAAGTVPLLANGKSIGTITVSDVENFGRRFTEDEVALLMAFADQAALALEKARMLNEAEREKERMVGLNEVVSDLATTLDFEAVSQKIADSARTLIGARIAIIFQLDQATGVLSLISLSGDSYPRFTEDFLLSDLGSIRSLCARERQTLVTPDFLADSRLTHTSDQIPGLEDLELRAFIGVPFIVQERVTGVLAVGDFTGRIFSDDDVELTQSFADQAAVAQENARLMGEAEREKERSDALYRVSSLLAGAHHTDEVLDLIVNEASRLVGASGALLRLLEGDDLVPGPATETVAGYFADAIEYSPTYR